MIPQHRETEGDRTQQLYRPNRRQLLKTSAGTLTALTGLTGASAVAAADEHDDTDNTVEELVTEVEQAVNWIGVIADRLRAGIIVDFRRTAINELRISVEGVEDPEPLLNTLDEAAQGNEQAGNAVVEGDPHEEHFVTTEEAVQDFQEQLDDELAAELGEQVNNIIESAIDPLRTIYQVDEGLDLQDIVRLIRGRFASDDVDTSWELVQRLDHHVQRVRTAAAGLRELDHGVYIDNSVLVIEGPGESFEITLDLSSFGGLMVALILGVGTVIVAGGLLGGTKAAIAGLLTGATLIGLSGFLLLLYDETYDSLDELLDDLAELPEQLADLFQSLGTFLTTTVIPLFSDIITDITDRLRDIEIDEDLIREIAEDAMELISTVVSFIVELEWAAAIERFVELFTLLVVEEENEEESTADSDVSS